MATILKDAAYMGFPLSIKRGNPAPVDTTAVWYSRAELEAYAQSGATSYVGQILTLYTDGVAEAYMISNEAGDLVKLAQTSGSGDVSADINNLNKKINALVEEVGKASSEGVDATGLYALIEAAQKQADKGVADAATADAKAQAAQDDLDALEAVVGADDTTGLRKRIAANEKSISTLVGEDTGKSARSIASEEVVKVVAGAPEAYDTLKEIADWISTHGTDATAMNSAIKALEAILDGFGTDEGETATVKEYVDDAIAALKIGDYAKAADLTALAGRVTAIEGKAAMGITADDIAKWNAKQDAGDYIEQSAYDTKVKALEDADAANSEAIAAVKKTADAAVIANTAITAGTATKVTYDEKGLVTKGENLAASDIPTLGISKIDGLQDALDSKQDNLVFDNTYNSSTNKVATVATVNKAVDNLIHVLDSEGKDIDTEDSNTIHGAKLYAKAQATAAKDLANANTKTITDSLDTRLKSVEEAVGGAGSVADAIATAKKEAIDAAKAETASQVSTAKEDILGEANYTHTVKDAYELAQSKTTMAEVEAKDYATKAEAKGYADAKDASIKAAKDAADKAQSTADANLITVNNTIDTTKSNLIGTNTDTTDKDTIWAAKNLASNVQSTLLGDDADTSADKTIYGALAAAKSAQDKANANEAAIGTDTTVGTVKYRVKTLETSVAKNAEDISANAKSIASLVGNMSGVFHFKGGATKTGSELYVDGKQVVEKSVGDVYTVGEEEYAWTGSEWIMLGITTDLSKYYDKTDIDKKLNGLTGAFHFKGVATRFDNIGQPIVDNPGEGDVWLDNDGAQWAWNGEQWIKLGYMTDLTGYATLTEVDAKIQGALNGLYTFKGEVESLDKVVSPLRGDVYVVPQADGSKKQYAYAGDGNWVEISTNVDLSDYAKTVDVNTKINETKNSVISIAAQDAKSKADTAEANALDAVDKLKGKYTGDNTVLTVGEIQVAVEGLQPLVEQNTNSITTINTSLAESGSVGSKIKANADAIAALQDADYADITAEDIVRWNEAQPNVIEKIQVNGKEIAVADKTVNIPLATAARAGLIVSSSAENQISIDSTTGVGEVNSLNVNKLVQTEGDFLVLDGGKAV